MPGPPPPAPTPGIEDSALISSSVRMIASAKVAGSVGSLSVVIVLLESVRFVRVTR